MEIAVVIVTVAAISLVAAAALYGFHLTNLIRDGSLSSRHATPQFDILASSEDTGRIVLRAIDRQTGAHDLHHDGVFGIVSSGGYGQVGRIIEQDDDHSIREYTPLTATIIDSEPARLDIYAYPDDPRVAHNIKYDNVYYKSELGDCPAWLIPGNSSTWVVFAHGRGAHPNESLRIMPTLVDAGLPVLTITYRNDDHAPASADRQHWLGLTEWRDLEAAMHYALDNGAEDFILYGYSMGGGMCLNLLYESPLAGKVRGVIMNSPVLDFGGTLDFVGRARGYPHFIVQLGKWIAGIRLGIDWERMNYLGRASDLRAPILALHGEADELIPAPLSQLLARARPDIVRYVGFADAGHARSWNSDPAKYESAVRDFLRDIGIKSTCEASESRSP